MLFIVGYTQGLDKTDKTDKGDASGMKQRLATWFGLVARLRLRLRLRQRQSICMNSCSTTI